MDNSGPFDDEPVVSKPVAGKPVAGKPAQQVTVIKERRPRIAHVALLTVQNFMGVELAEIAPDPARPVKLMGENDNGKTSVWKALEALIFGMANVPGRPVRDGASQADLHADLGDIVVDRIITPDRKSRLKVTAKIDGRPMTSPQEVLKAMYGHMVPDPMALRYLRPAELVTTMLAKWAPDFDLAATAAMRQKVFDGRTTTNRLLKETLAQLEAFDDLPDEKPERVVVTELWERREALADAMRGREDATRRLQKLGRQDGQLMAEIEALLKKQRTLRVTIEAAKTEFETLHKEQSTAALEESLAAIAEQVADAENINRSEDRWREREILQGTAKDMRKEAEDATAELEKIDAEKAAVLAAIDFPIPGLTIEEAQLSIEGIPLDQCAMSKQIVTYTAIAMGPESARPLLPIVPISDGNLLDKKTLHEVEQFTAERGFHLWIELVKSKDEHGQYIDAEPGFYIDQGAVALQLPDEAAAADYNARRLAAV